MKKLFYGMRGFKADSFTLVELLVVISIIGLLAGLSVPAIQGGLDKAKQQTDVSNIRQLGMILFADAMENEGQFKSGNTTYDVVTNLIINGLLNSPKILSGTGFRSASSTNINSISATNIAWSLVDGLTTSDNGVIPLLLSKGVPQLNSNVSLANVTTGWKNKGIAVYRVQNSAEFIRAGSGGAPAGTVNTGLEAAVPNRILP